MHDGQKLFRKTREAAHRLAQQLADDTGRQVTVREVESNPAPKRKRQSVGRYDEKLAYFAGVTAARDGRPRSSNPHYGKEATAWRQGYNAGMAAIERMTVKRNPVGRGTWPGLTDREREYAADVVTYLRRRGVKITPTVKSHVAYMAQDKRATSKGAADLIEQWAKANIHGGSAYDVLDYRHRPPARIAARRNPVMAGVDYTGERWAVVGVGPRGRLETTENTRRDAELMAEYLYRQGYRALTIRRTAKGAAPTAGAKRTTIDNRAGSARRRRA